MTNLAPILAIRCSPKLLTSTFLSLLLGPSLVSAQHAVKVPMTPAPQVQLFVPDEFVIELTRDSRQNLRIHSGPNELPRVSDRGLQVILDGVGAQQFKREFPSTRLESQGSQYPDLTGYYTVKLPANGMGIDEAMNRFAAYYGVDHVEKIGIHFLDATPNDPYYQDSPDLSFPYDQWHYWSTHGIGADLAWDIETGDSNVVVAVLDSGVRYFHVDLGGNHGPWDVQNPLYGGNIWRNTGELPNNGLDDDANGFVDDVIGWDFVSSGGGAGVTCLDQDCSIVDNNPDDGDGHGTHVSGTIAAITNNGRTVSGVAGGYSNGLTTGTGNGVKLMCLRIGYHGRYQGQTTGIVRMDWAAQAMSYVASLVDDGVNVTAINCSWGSSNSGGLGAAIAALTARDVVIVHSAGNSNSSVPDYLGSLSEVVNVAATDTLGAGASFTNYGSYVDFAAPGVDILSTYANPDDPDLTHNYIALLSGTSMSSPHVVGCIALLESYLPGLSGPAKIDYLTTTTTPYDDSRDLGSGIVNIKNALIAAQSQIGIANGGASIPAVALLAAPNPARAGTNLIVRSPVVQRARVAVFDVGGRLVSEIAKGTLAEGDNHFRWDARNERGNKVNGGIYFVIVQISGHNVASKKIVLVN